MPFLWIRLVEDGATADGGALFEAITFLDYFKNMPDHRATGAKSVGAIADQAKLVRSLT